LLHYVLNGVGMKKVPWNWKTRKPWKVPEFVSKHSGHPIAYMCMRVCVLN